MKSKLASGALMALLGGFFGALIGAPPAKLAPSSVPSPVW